MKKEFNLSEKGCKGKWNYYFHEKDIKEFIKILKEEIDEIEYGNIEELAAETINNSIKKRIDKLAGKELI